MVYDNELKQKQTNIVDAFAGERRAASINFAQFRGRMIAPKTCSEALDNSEFTIHRWIREGKIKAVKLSSRCTRIDGDSLADFLCSRVFTPGAKEAQPEPLKRSSAKRTKHTAVELAGQA